jgi:uncharacterized repeat protein (TIGR01451 family)
MVNGLQGSPVNMVRSANERPATSYFIDYDDKFDDASASGHMGSVRILALPCATSVADSGHPPNSNPANITPAGCVGPNCRNACTPTCICPPGTVLEGKDCVNVRVCPPGTVMRNGECARVEMLQIKCTPPMVPNSSGTTCICPQGTVQQGRQCVPVTQTCPAPMVPGPCTCPDGTMQEGGLCVSAKPIDLGIGKTGGTTPFCPAPNYDFMLTVTNVGNGFPGTNNIVVTDIVPNGMRFDTATGTNWTCVTLPATAGSTITCTYTGPAPTLGQVLPTITIGVTALDPAPFPPYTNCANVAMTPGSGYADSNSANNNACVTVAKPSTCACPAPQVMNADSICSCPQGTVPQGGKCVTPPKCPPPQVPNVDGICMCPAPMLPGAIPGACSCPASTVILNGKCVTPVTRCPPPLIPNADGKCVKPGVKPKREKPKQGQEQEEPRRQERVFEPERIPGIGIPGLGGGGGFGGGPRGGGQGGGESPGRR